MKIGWGIWMVVWAEREKGNGGWTWISIGDTHLDFLYVDCCFYLDSSTSRRWRSWKQCNKRYTMRPPQTLWSPPRYQSRFPLAALLQPQVEGNDVNADIRAWWIFLTFFAMPQICSPLKAEKKKTIVKSIPGDTESKSHSVKRHIEARKTTTPPKYSTDSHNSRLH